MLRSFLVVAVAAAVAASVAAAVAAGGRLPVRSLHSLLRYALLRQNVDQNFLFGVILVKGNRGEALTLQSLVLNGIVASRTNFSKLTDELNRKWHN